MRRIRLVNGIRYVAATAITNTVLNGVKMLSSLLTIPLLLSQFGQDGLGYWLIALSVLGLTGFLQTGLGGAAITAIGGANSSLSKHEVDKFATSALSLATLLSLITLIVGLIFISITRGQDLGFFDDPLLNAQVDNTEFVLVICISLGFLSYTAKSILVAISRGYYSYIFELIGLVVSLALFVLCTILETEISTLIFVFIFPQLLLTLFGCISWAHISGSLRFKLNSIELKKIKYLTKEGGRLALSQASNTIATNSDMLFVGYFLGAEFTAAYGVAQRLFSIPLMLLATVNDAMWPEYSKWKNAGESAKAVSKYWRTSTVLTAIASFLCFIIYWKYDAIILLWLGEAFTKDWLLIFGMAFWGTLSVYIHATNTLLKAFHKSQILVQLTMFMTIINVTVSVALIHTIGVAGAIWGTVIAHGICFIVPYFRILPNMPDE